MKKWQKILLIVLLVAALVITVTAIKNWPKIKILYKGITTSKEDILKEKEKVEERAQQAAKDYGIDEIRPLSEDESKQLAEGELTEEEAINIILGYTFPEEQPEQNPDVQNPSSPESQNAGTDTPPSNAPSGTAAPQQNAPSSAPTSNSSQAQSNQTQKPTQKPQQYEQDPTKEKVARLLGKMYVLKSQFTSDLEAIEAEAKEEFKSLPKEERKQESTKWRIGAEALDRATSLERQCDAEVNAVLDELTSVLNESNQSTALVDEVRNSYESEKELTKSYYISKFQE